MPDEQWFRDVGARYKKIWRNKSYWKAFFFSFTLLFLSLGCNVLAGMYATERATGAVGDIILSNIPLFDVDMIFVYGPIIFWTILSIFVLTQPQKIPYWIKTVALFVVIRSIFITLTHIGPFPDAIPVDSLSVGKNVNFFIFSSGADLFFSAHTGLPFINALIFWDNPRIRFYCIAGAVFFGIVVLMGHLHYSIDVLSAFFITFTINHLAKKLYKKEKVKFDEKITA